MGYKSNKVIGIVGSSELAKRYIMRNYPDTYMNFFILETNEKMVEKESVLKYMQMWSKQYAEQKFNDNDLITFLYIAGLDEKIHSQIGELTTGERKRLLFLKVMLANQYNYIIQELFTGVDDADIEILTQMIIELSTYIQAIIILTAEDDTGFSICDEVIVLKDET